jgi:uncharacterized integral membrane protein
MLPLDSTQHVLAQLARIDDAISKEFSLVSERMTWLVISESFIFAAFTSAVANYRPEHKMALSLLFLVWILPLVGFLFALLVYPAILAAHVAAFKLKTLREELEVKLPQELQITLISSKNKEHFLGNIPPYAIPPIIILMWVVLVIVLLVLSARGGFV